MKLGKTCKYKQSQAWAHNPKETQIWICILGWDGSSSRCSTKCSYI